MFVGMEYGYVICIYNIYIFAFNQRYDLGLSNNLECIPLYGGFNGNMCVIRTDGWPIFRQTHETLSGLVTASSKKHGCKL